METETARLLLRRFTPDDAENMFRIYSDAQTMKFMGAGPPSIEDERRAIQKHITDYYDRFGYGYWAVVLKADARLIGRCGIIHQEIDGNEVQELSYLLDRSYWGHGFASEAAQQSVFLAHSQFGIQRLIALILPENRRSIRVIEKCGFSLERMLPAFKIWTDVCLYSRLIES